MNYPQQQKSYPISFNSVHEVIDKPSSLKVDLIHLAFS